MFVIMYDLSDMPADSQTFVRQRILDMPLGESDSHPDAQKWLRYLINLRFATSRSGRMFLHTDLRIVIFRKSDADTAMGHSNSTPHELRSFTYTPDNPKYSPRFPKSSSHHSALSSSSSSSSHNNNNNNHISNSSKHEQWTNCVSLNFQQKRKTRMIIWTWATWMNIMYNWVWTLMKRKKIIWKTSRVWI